MRQQDWDDLKQQMGLPYGHMKLKCDQFVVTLTQQINPKSHKWVTTAYVGEEIKGIWCETDKDNEPKHEEAKRFWRRVTRRRYSAKQVEAYRKAFGKREANKIAAEVYAYYLPSWNSFNSLKKHLLANNISIERIH